MTSPLPRPDTKQLILDAAERLFADHGLAATSLRDVISSAGVNLAAVHYHFGSKDNLIDAVILRRVTRVNQDRLELLDRCERAAGRRPPKVEGILEAFIAPTLLVASDPERGGAPFVRLMGRIQAEGDIFPRILRNHFGEVLGRFGKALQRALPGLPPAELFWRMYFAAGAMAHTLKDGGELALISNGLCDTSDHEAVTRRMVAFLAPGFRVPAPRLPSSRKKGSK